MSKFDASNWSKNKLAYLVIIVVLVILIIYASRTISLERKGKGIPNRQHADGNGTAYYYGRGSKDDSVSELLDRIHWSSYVDKRVSQWAKLIIVSVIVAILIAVLVMRELPKPSRFIIQLLVIYIPFYSTYQLNYVHGDIYNDYYIKRNVELIRKKLGLGHSSGEVSDPKTGPPRRAHVMNPK